MTLARKYKVTLKMILVRKIQIELVSKYLKIMFWRENSNSFNDKDLRKNSKFFRNLFGTKIQIIFLIQELEDEKDFSTVLARKFKF